MMEAARGRGSCLGSLDLQALGLARLMGLWKPARSHLAREGVRALGAHFSPLQPGDVNLSELGGLGSGKDVMGVV